MEIINKSPFKAECFTGKDYRGINSALVLVKATYSVDENGVISIADEQDDFALGDMYREKPEDSSLYYSNDICFEKLSSDVGLEGTVYMQPEEDAKLAKLSVGMVEKEVVAFPLREWRGTAGIYKQVVTDHLEEVPLVYECAFGGEDYSNVKEKHHQREGRNPIGMGFVAKKTDEKISGKQIPLVEDIDNIIKKPKDTPPPAGFGFIAPTWEPRCDLVGTIDPEEEEPRTELPEDFDPRFFNSAHPDLIYPGFLMGGEPVNVEGIGHNNIRFNIPVLNKKIIYKIDDENHKKYPMQIDKFFIDIDLMKFNVLLRCKIEVTEFGENSFPELIYNDTSDE